MPLPGSSPADVPYRPARWGTVAPAAPGPSPAVTGPSASAAPGLRSARHPCAPDAVAGPASGPWQASGPPEERTAPGRRSARPGPATRRPDGPAERLWRLAESIDEALADGPPGDGALVFLRGAGLDAPAAAEVDLGWLPLDGRHPLDVLVGLRAPDDWQALGVACSGGIVPTSTAEHHHGRHGGPRTAVRVTTLLDRAGRSASVLRVDGRPRRLGEAPDGAVGDALRRALGLPTAPPPATTAPLWVAWWLDRIVDRALADGPPSTWADVAALHPACPFSLPGRGPRPATLARAAADLASRWPWHRLRTDAAAADVRARAVEGHGVGPGIPGLPTPADAAWMDDGMFARWVFGALPMLPDLVDACRSVVPIALYEEVEAVIEATVRTHASAPPPPPAPAAPDTDDPEPDTPPDADDTPNEPVAGNHDPGDIEPDPTPGTTRPHPDDPGSLDPDVSGSLAPDDPGGPRPDDPGSPDGSGEGNASSVSPPGASHTVAADPSDATPSPGPGSR